MLKTRKSSSTLQVIDFQGVRPVTPQRPRQVSKRDRKAEEALARQQREKEHRERQRAQLQEQFGWFRKLVKEFESKLSSETAPATRPITKNPDMVVVARLRPLLAQQDELDQPHGVVARPDAPGIIDAHLLRRSALDKPPTLQSSSFTLDHIYPPEASTQSVYNDVVKPLLSSAWNGGFGTLFAHGQTGSGKTHTISNLQRYLSKDIFFRHHRGTHDVYLTVIELAGNSAHDLLASNDDKEGEDDNSPKAISVREDSFGEVHLQGAEEHKVKNKEAMMRFFEKAAKCRRTSATEKNPASSRSHAIYRIRFVQKLHKGSPIGVLYMIDLAGSEAARDTVHNNQRLKETREINASLSALNACIRAKAEVAACPPSKKPPRVPFRQSALTKVLKHIFGATSQQKSKMAVIGCVNPCLADVAASKNTLRYVQLCRAMDTKAKPIPYDPEIPATWSNSEVRAWITENSGTPPVDAAILAPYESGEQLVRLSEPDFKSRCLETPKVSVEQAYAFYRKLWFMHVESKTPKSKSEDQASSASLRRTTSKNPNPKAHEIPFKSRLIPGTVVHWTPPQNFPLKYPGENMVLVLSDTSTLPPHAEDFFGNLCRDNSTVEPGVSYFCAVMTPGSGMTRQAYNLQVWQNIVVHIDSMVKEVVMAYDEHSRQYFIEV